MMKIEQSVPAHLVLLKSIYDIKLFSGTSRLVVDLRTARIKPLASGGHRARGCRRRQTRAAGQEGGRAPWRQDGFRQTAARVVRRTTPSECGEGEQAGRLAEKTQRPRVQGRRVLQAPRVARGSVQ